MSPTTRDLSLLLAAIAAMPTPWKTWPGGYGRMDLGRCAQDPFNIALILEEVASLGARASGFRPAAAF